MIDLHCHSTYSDGMLTPQALLEKAEAAGLKMIALTDHDTVAGLDFIASAGLKFNGQIIPGIEISTRFAKHDIHILGLNIQKDCSAMVELIAEQKDKRMSRSLKIADCLSALGIQNAWDKAVAIAGHERVSRPHFARVLMDEEKVKDMKAAFKRFLGRGKPAYVPTEWVSISDAVATIIAAGGDAVIAHPLKYALTQTKLVALITTFKEAGGVGMEVVSGETSPSEADAMAMLCERFNLFASSGSDYHGEGMSRISLGRQRRLPLVCKPIWAQWA